MQKNKNNKIVMNVISSCFSSSRLQNSKCLILIFSLVLLFSCKDDYHCSCYDVQPTGQVSLKDSEILLDVTKGEADYFAKTKKYTLCVDQKNEDEQFLSDSSIIKKIWDCNNDFGGGAYIDICGDCVGGKTKKENCSGEVTNPNPNTYDCAGVYGGSAYYDNCQICVGGTTGKFPCTNTYTYDCAGVYGGSAYYDNCQICVGGTTGRTACQNNTYDCAGIYGGTAYYDDCYNCVGGNTGKSECIADIEGNKYSTKVIGTQTWMAENLRTTKFNNGANIYSINSSLWSSYNQSNLPSMSLYSNYSPYQQTYGGLYNHSVVSSPNNVCPTGWHVPTQQEYAVLANYVSNQAVYLKSTSSWSVNGYDSYGFKGLPGGHIDNLGNFGAIGTEGFWWTSTKIGVNAYSFNMYSTTTSINYNSYNTSYGASIRCLKDK